MGIKSRALCARQTLQLNCIPAWVFLLHSFIVRGHTLASARGWKAEHKLPNLFPCGVRNHLTSPHLRVISHNNESIMIVSHMLLTSFDHTPLPPPHHPLLPLPKESLFDFSLLVTQWVSLELLAGAWHLISYTAGENVKIESCYAAQACLKLAILLPQQVLLGL